MSSIKNSRAKQRGTSERIEVDGLLKAPSCLAVYFTWPQVALTHHVFHVRLYADSLGAVKFAASVGMHADSLAHCINDFSFFVSG
jgi:hypothetical protein